MSFLLLVECFNFFDHFSSDAELSVDRAELVSGYFDQWKLFVEGKRPCLQAVAYLLPQRLLRCQIVDVLLSEFTEIRSFFQSFLLLPFTFFVGGRR